MFLTAVSQGKKKKRKRWRDAVLAGLGTSAENIISEIYNGMTTDNTTDATYIMCHL